MIGCRCIEQVGVYEASKIEAHFAIKQWATQTLVPLTVIHPATVIGDSQTGALASNQGFYQSLVDLFAGKLIAVPAGQGYRLPLVSVDYVAEFLAHVIDYKQSIGQEYVLADNKTPDLKTVLTMCARSVNVVPPRFSVPIPVLRILLKSSWVAQKTGLSNEILHFFRQESLNVDTANQLAMTMGLSQVNLTQILGKTAQYVQQRV
jgi:dihydroflavonol-4-reductase